MLLNWNDSSLVTDIEDSLETFTMTKMMMEETTVAPSSPESESSYMVEVEDIGMVCVVESQPEEVQVVVVEEKVTQPHPQEEEDEVPELPDEMAAVATTLAEGYIDANLAQAAIQAMETGTVLPLIKQELRCSIQNKRLMEGKDELELDEKRPQSPEQLTPEEEERRQKRRQRNKEAAQRCRNKRKDRSDALEDETDALQSKQARLQEEVRQLENERDNLCMMLQSHDIRAGDCNVRFCVNPANVTPAPSSDRNHKHHRRH